MTDESGNLTDDKPGLKSVHQCIRCGTTCERDQISEEEMIAGVLVCRVCGHSGPLRVVVVRT